MKGKLLLVGCVGVLLFLQSCKHEKQVSFSIRNQDTYSVDVYYTQKTDKAPKKLSLKPGEEQKLYSLTLQDKELEWERNYNYHIVSVVRKDSAISWKDLNVEGAWSAEEKEEISRQVLIINDEDF